MELSELFTKKNMQILQLLMKESLHLRDVASRLQCSPAKVHDSIQLFKKHDLVHEYKEKNRKVIVLNKQSQLLKKIMALVGEGPEDVSETINIYDTISPLDYRYYGRHELLVKTLGKYLSEEAMIKYMLNTEQALVSVLAKRKVCGKDVADEVEKACRQIRAAEVYKEEDRIRHNVRALVNCIRKRVSEKAKPYVHFTATSHDIICTADAARYKDVALHAVVPVLIELEKTLLMLALREKSTIQIGRTHGQHAEPITFGFAMAEYVSRLGNRIMAIKKTAANLRGKIAGAVGAYNASSLFFSDPGHFEKDVLAELGLKPSLHSTQIVEPEYQTDFMNAVISCFSVLANLSDDMRNLQRSEISEVAESFGKEQVGSSTMPHKRNPINFENVKSMWKVFMPRMTTLYLDQICDHQRDLTNSASARFVPEIIVGLVASAVRLNNVMGNLVVDKDSLRKNFDMSKDMIAAEPAYILLAAHNHPDAHEHVRKLTAESRSKGRKFAELFFKDKSLRPYTAQFTKKQLLVLKNPEQYIGKAAEKVDEVCSYWKKELKL